MSCGDDWDFRNLQSIVDQQRYEIEKLKRKDEDKRYEIEKLKRKYEELFAIVDGMKK